MNIARKEIIKTIAANAGHIEGQMSTFWKSWAEDLIKGGIPAEQVTSSMLSVASAQCMAVFGASFMAKSLHRMADVFETSASYGVEFPAREH